MCSLVPASRPVVFARLLGSDLDAVSPVRKRELGASHAVLARLGAVFSALRISHALLMRVLLVSHRMAAQHRHPPSRSVRSPQRRLEAIQTMVDSEFKRVIRQPVSVGSDPPHSEICSRRIFF